MAFSKNVSRRSFLKKVGMGALAAGVASGFYPFRVSGQPAPLKIMQWTHFVPAFDQWFDPYAKAWGQNHNPPVDVTVDHISFADILTRASAEVAAQAGHDLFFFLAPPPAFEQQVIDHREIVEAVTKKHGPITQLAQKSTFNPVTKKWFAFSDFFTIDPFDLHKDIWDAIGKPNGPTTWQELLEAGDQIRAKFPTLQVPIGVGYSNDVDSNMAMRALMWSFDAYEQDENQNVALNSANALEALKFGVQLFKRANPVVLTWDAVSNNLAFNAHQTGIILNSISAYRTAQLNNLKVPGTDTPLAENTFFVGPLKGPRGTAINSEHVMSSYVIWKFAKQQDLAKEFLVSLVDNYSSEGFASPGAQLPGTKGAVLNSKLYNTPSFLGAAAPKSVTDPAKRSRAGYEWLRDQFNNDPFNSKPANKLAPLFSAVEEPSADGTSVKQGWSTNIGHPGPAHAAIGQIFDEYVIPQLFAQAALAHGTPEALLKQYDDKFKEIFNFWRKQGLSGGDPSKDK
ncbi:extracellular solute-binding protein [Candidatus Acetothermia bacterium]|nr:extracellular solute-binding protein [Candidatus Acetothermia bacterium]